MGIPRLTTFLSEKFSYWSSTTLKEWDHVIVDGSTICYILYRDNHPWIYGGEYNQFVGTVTNFCKKFKNNKSPIFVFDGALCDRLKEETQRKHRIDVFKKMRNEQQQMDPSPDEEDKVCAPLHLIYVFMDTLLKLDVKFHVANGDADNEIAALANHYECPVLSSDSDFFIYNLKSGFIHFDRLCADKLLPFYHVKHFQNQFSLRQHDLCLLIPLVFGNDMIDSNLLKENFTVFLQKLSRYNTAKEYLCSDKKPAHCTPENYEIIERQYSCDPSIHLPGGSHSNRAFRSLPKWVATQVDEGCFSPQLLEIYLKGICLLPRAIEVMKKDSVWVFSREIRQYLYGFIGKLESDKITEIVRKDCTSALIDQEVSPKLLKPPLAIQQIETMRTEEKLDIVLSVLKCHKISEDDIKCQFHTLSYEWKLPIAATFYWYRKLKLPVDKRDVIAKALMLNFLACSGVIKFEAHSWYDEVFMDDLQAFAQWQCVYFDAVALNHLARDPINTTSPASLYSGEVAMYYAFLGRSKPNWVDEVLGSDSRSPQRRLFNTFLYLVTGRNEYGDEGQHAPKLRLGAAVNSS